MYVYLGVCVYMVGFKIFEKVGYGFYASACMWRAHVYTCTSECAYMHGYTHSLTPKYTRKYTHAYVSQASYGRWFLKRRARNRAPE